MIITISSGNSVDEVCRAIWHFKNWLDKNFEFRVLKLEYAKCENGFKSMVLETKDERFLELQGTHLWHSLSPFRPKHKRKNWYFTLNIEEKILKTKIDKTKIVYQTMKSPKKGGQHVNTTCSGVRAVYHPLNIEAISYDERSQYQNKQIALSRLLKKIEDIDTKSSNSAKTKRWKDGKEVVRGGAVKTFEGEMFLEVLK